jgi:hypothetical protein
MSLTKKDLPDEELGAGSEDAIPDIIRFSWIQTDWKSVHWAMLSRFGPSCLYTLVLIVIAFASY